MMFLIPLVTWLLLLNQQILVNTAAIKTTTIKTTTLQTETSAENDTLIEADVIDEMGSLIPAKDNDDDDERMDTAVALSDDVIELNIGGQKMTTLRSTLTVLPNSKLAKMFRKENTKSLSMDKQGAAFFDYNPVHFTFLLDQLRAIKRMPKKPGYQVQFQVPYIGSQTNFTHMLVDLGLTRIFQSNTCDRQVDIIKSNTSLTDYFLSPREGTHINLTVSSLAGWKECYRSTYDTPFSLSVLKKSCNGSQLLVACRPVNNKKILTLAGIGHYEDVSNPCLPKECKANGNGNGNGNGKSKKKNKKEKCSPDYQCITQAKRGVGWYNANNQTWGFVRGSLSFVVNPCDSSSLDADYRLCWTSQIDNKQGTGDRCGKAKNLQNSNKWERLIYYIT